MHAMRRWVPDGFSSSKPPCAWRADTWEPGGDSRVRASVQHITSPVLIIVKATLFVVLGTLAATLLVARDPTATTVSLVAVTTWAFARAYFFAFSVIEHYIDPGYRYAGLISTARWIVARAYRDTPRQ